MGKTHGYANWVCGGIFYGANRDGTQRTEPRCICTKNCTPTHYDWSQHRR